MPAGLSRPLQGNDVDVPAGNHVGTIMYTAPEIFQDSRLTKPGDVYAFGIMSKLYILPLLLPCSCLCSCHCFCCFQRPSLCCPAYAQTLSCCFFCHCFCCFQIPSVCCPACAKSISFSSCPDASFPPPLPLPQPQRACLAVAHSPPKQLPSLTDQIVAHVCPKMDVAHHYLPLKLSNRSQ